MDNQQTISAFPDLFASTEEKKSPEWGLEFVKAAWARITRNDASFMDTWRRDIITLREYAEGLQSVERYKPLLDESGGDSSFINIDWSIYPIIPKFISVIENAIINREFGLFVKATDSLAKSKKDEARKEFETNIAFKDFDKDLEALTGIPFSNRGKEGPQKKEDVDSYMDTEFKLAEEIALELGLDFFMDINDWPEIKKRIVQDIIRIGRAVTLTETTANGPIVRYIDPIGHFSAPPQSPDFEGIPYQGHVEDMEIHEFRNRFSVDFSDEDLRDLVNCYSGNNGNPAIPMSMNDFYGLRYNTNVNRLRIRVARIECVTSDEEVYQKKYNSRGSYRLKKKDGRWKPALNSKHEKFSYTKQNVYSGYWVVGTNIITQWGLEPDMIRPRSSFKKAYSSYTVYAPGLMSGRNTSVVKRIIPIADEIQVTVLKRRQLIAKLTPPGVAIEVGSVENVSKGEGQGNFTPLEVGDVYQQTGRLYYRVLADDGTPLSQKPITELPGSDGRQLIALQNIYNNLVEQIRDAIGVNEFRDGSSISSETLVGVQNTAIAASNNATSHLTDAYVSILKRTCSRAILRMQRMSDYSIPYEGYVRALGDSTMDIISLTKNLSIHDFGLFVEIGADDAEKAFLDNLMITSLNKGLLNEADILLLRTIKNTKKRAKVARKMIKDNQEKAHQEKIDLQMANAKVQQDSIAAKLQADIAFEQEKGKIEIYKEIIKALIKKDEIMSGLQGQALLAGAQNEINSMFQQKAAEQAQAQMGQQQIQEQQGQALTEEELMSASQELM